MKLPQTGGCQCGALRYEVTAAPLVTYICHCTNCQRFSGSAFSVGIVVPESAFKLIRGEPRLLQHVADSGRTVTRWLCPACGCSIVGDPQPRGPSGQLIRRIRAGTLDDTSWLRPTMHVWTRSRQPWVTLPEGDEVFETQPG